jgi:predicted ATPase
VEHLLRSCPKVHVLGTSREALNIDGEMVWRVPPLSLPGATQIGESEAVQLFVDRARSCRASLSVKQTPVR